MPRLARQRSASGYYHVLARGHNRQEIFRDDADYRRYLSELTRFKGLFPAKCYHFCLMPNHVHLLLQTDDIEILTAFIRRVQQAYQLHWRRRHRLVGHLWQGRFKSIPIEQESYLLECARYIERNPVRAGLCENPEEYAWSSARIYLTGNFPIPKFLDPSPVFASLASDDSMRRHLYRDYVSRPRPYEQLVDTQLARLT